MPRSDKLSAPRLTGIAVLLALAAWVVLRPRVDYQVTVGAKTFTESRTLSEIAAMLARQAGYTAGARELGGTQILWYALLAGEIDVYPEYTGTIRKEIFPQYDLSDDQALRDKLAEMGILATQPLGFNNSYALGMKEEVAQRLGIRTAADLTDHPNLRYGFSNEFLQREDGWPALQRTYQLQGEVTGLEHQLAYIALEGGDLDVVDVYMTDPAIKAHGLRVLEDNFFPAYDALLLYRADLKRRAPEVVEQLSRLAGAIDESDMRAMNERVEKPKGDSEQRAGGDFVQQKLGIDVEVVEPTLWQRLCRTTAGHLELVLWSLTAAILLAVPLGVLAAKRPVAGQFILAGAEILQTIPGLALLVFLSAMFQAADLNSIGKNPVIVALFLYSLLPIIRNTMTGIQDVPARLKESAVALGLTGRDQLLRIELPLASRTILAGIKTTAVINVGYATLGGLIGAVCYGEPIMTGLRKNSTMLMLEGAVPAALMALAVKYAFELAERAIVPRGLRI